LTRRLRGEMKVLCKILVVRLRLGRPGRIGKLSVTWIWQGLLARCKPKCSKRIPRQKKQNLIGMDSQGMWNGVSDYFFRGWAGRRHAQERKKLGTIEFN